MKIIKFIKVLFCLFCIVVASALFIVSSYFSIQFYKFGLDSEFESTIFIITVLAISVELIKFVLSFTAPLIKDRDAELDFKIDLALKLSLMLSILASLTYFLVVHSTYSPVERIINLIYDVFLVPLDLDMCRTQVIFIFNCFFSILIEYFIILLPAISTLPFREKKEDLIKEKGIIFMINESIKILVRIPVESLYGFANMKKAEMELSNRQIEKKIKTIGEEKEEPVIRNHVVDEGDPNINHDKNNDLGKLEKTDNSNGNVISFEKVKGSTGKKYDETKKAYLDYITLSKNIDNSIPTNKEVLEHFESTEYIFNPRKITKIKKDLYQENILIEPVNLKDGTFFTEDYIKKINDIDIKKNDTSDIDININTNENDINIKSDTNETLEGE